MKALSGVDLRELALGRRRSCEPGHLDVWLLSTHMTVADRDAYECVLLPDERQRAQRFVHTADHDRSIVGRGGLRRILSLYTGTPPRDLGFELNAYGKPFLAAATAGPSFNLSHSGDFVLLGVTSETECGVDIECRRAASDEESIAEQFFCPREIAWLKRTDGGFLRLWAAKEAVVKAVGTGLSTPLSDIDVTDIVAGTASLLSIGSSLVGGRDIWVRELDMGEGYVAAVAVLGGHHVLRFCPEEG